MSKNQHFGEKRTHFYIFQTKNTFFNEIIKIPVKLAGIFSIQTKIVVFGGAAMISAILSGIKKIVENHYFKNNTKDITKNRIPRIKVILLITSSNPLSFWCPNKFSLPPVIIPPASLALFPCKRTIAISNTDITSNIFSNILTHPFH